MQSIKKRLSILFFICSISAIILITLFVNYTVNQKFDEYVIHNEDKRHEHIVTFFKEAYEKEGKWTDVTGIELMHEAYMGNYYLTLWDADKEFVWGMNPSDIQSRFHQNLMGIKEKGVYNTKTFEIESEGALVGYVEVGQYSSVLLTEEDINFKSSINKSILASGIITLVLVIGISIIFSKHFSTPIKDMAKMSVELSKGNFDIKSMEKGNIQELEELRTSINILADKLKHQDRLRKRLITDITHEIRAPLNVLQNNLEAMIDKVFPVTKERLNSLNEEVIRFGKLLSTLNSLKKFESESSQLNFQIVLLDELIEDIIKDFELLSESKDIKLWYTKEDNRNFEIIGDRDSLKQVFINLLANAYKYNRPNGEVRILLTSNLVNIKVQIEDTGMGIKEEDLPFIFERLYRGDKSRQLIEGDGIGLTIVKSILQLHNSNIEVSSQEGKGTKFTIEFNK